MDTLEQIVPRPVAATQSMPAQKTSLIGLTRDELAHELRGTSVPEKALRMRASQLWHWIYLRGATSFDVMTTIGKDLRGELDAQFTLARPEITTEQVSTDGTRKWLLRLDAQSAREIGPQIECVFIPEKTRGTLCISSQIGCTLACTFCHTGTQKLVRNLTPGKSSPRFWSPGTGWRNGRTAPGPASGGITNVVLMGMGEPLYNFDNVKSAIDIMPTMRACRCRNGGSPCRPRVWCR